MVNRWADKQLKNCEAALLSLEAGLTQFNQATTGLIDSLAAGTSLSYLQQTYSLNWHKIWQEIAQENLWGPQSYQLGEWLSQQEKDIEKRLLQLELLISEYRLHIHHSVQKATDFWLGYDEGKVRCRTPYAQEPFIIGYPTPYQKGELLGWRYAIAKYKVQNLLECCNTSSCELFTWG
ncbi:hypothetical protein [Aerosakkonema funiforme]|uniref:Uncharacterized protein n=2 Tax=Oscillatoriophycideae TaxID=1301283 RepID=A0A926ZLL7_9CYAN|nr:hypothetical protein [Aerosakkonema funiforme]MBD2185196.1 hypothetical protein [Aerosakkonema funiforme FACHB-1375]